MQSAEPTVAAGQVLRATPWPSADLEAVDRCPACSGQSRQMLYDHLWDASFLAAPGEWSLWRCLDCRSAYLDPRPSPDSLGRAYASYYTHAQTENDPGPSGLGAAFKRALANGYRNWRFGGRRRPATRLGALIGSVLPTLREHIDYAFRYLPRPSAAARMLDVGCGNGQWLEQARDSGWQVSGVDFDPTAVARARASELDVRIGSIEAWAEARETFDAITMSHVIEHVPDPSAFVRAAYDLLRPGGTLYIDTPNIDAPTHKRFGQSWRGLEAPRHLVILSQRALIDLVESAGFEQINYHRPPGVTEFLVAASEAMQTRGGAGGTSEQMKQCGADESSEFLTITCRRPSLGAPTAATLTGTAVVEPDRGRH